MIHDTDRTQTQYGNEIQYEWQSAISNHRLDNEPTSFNGIDMQNLLIVFKLENSQEFVFHRG